MLEVMVECLEVETPIQRQAPTASGAAGDSRQGEISEGLFSQGFLPQSDIANPIIPIYPITVSTSTEYRLIERL